MSQRDDVATVELPADVVSRVESRVAYTEFDSVEAYVTHVLEDVLYYVEGSNDLGSAETVDEGQVEDRLKALGYLNE